MGKYDHINFKPPQSVANAAARSLELYAKTSGANRPGTPVGIARARSLKNRDNISPEIIRDMVGFFARHEGNQAIDPKHKGEPWRDNGYVSWLFWGGDPGKAWANKVARQMDAADEMNKGSLRDDIDWFLKAEIIPPLIGEMLFKGAQHKYVRRVPTGKTTKTGKPRYRYYYRVTGGKNIGHHDEFKVGAAFKVKHNGKEGHFHVTGVDGDKVTVRHDETGKSQTISKETLSNILQSEHATAIGSARDAAAKRLADAEKYGSEKQKKRAREYAERVGVRAPVQAVVGRAKRDLDPQVVEDSFRNSVRNPAAFARAFVSNYIQKVEGASRELLSVVDSKKMSEAAQDLDRLRVSLLEKEKSILSTESRIVSPIVVGPSASGSRRSKQAMKDAREKKEQRDAWFERQKKRLVRKYSPAKEPRERPQLTARQAKERERRRGAEEALSRLTPPAQRSSDVLRERDEEQEYKAAREMRGMSPRERSAYLTRDAPVSGSFASRVESAVKGDERSANLFSAMSQYDVPRETLLQQFTAKQLSQFEKDGLIAPKRMRDGAIAYRTTEHLDWNARQRLERIGQAGAKSKRTALGRPPAKGSYGARLESYAEKSPKLGKIFAIAAQDPVQQSQFPGGMAQARRLVSRGVLRATPKGFRLNQEINANQRNRLMEIAGR